MDIPKIMEIALDGVRASMLTVRAGQGRRVDEIETKSHDDTIVTAIDRLSSERAEIHLRKIEIPLWSEDGAHDTATSRYWQFFDPLDGTSVFAAGFTTSTVIWSLYDAQNRRVLATIVGEPVSGRVWYAIENMPTTLIRLSGLNMETKLEPTQETRVDPSSMSRAKTVVCLDVSHGFKRGPKQLLTDDEAGDLFGLLNKRVKVNIPGSNGLIQALVANGGSGVIGSITTALGGPWDACGVLLVLQAGGYARAFRKEEGSGLLSVINPLSVEDYDFLICGNTQQTVEDLVWCFRRGTYGELSTD